MCSLTAHNIQLKAFECWELWEEFAKCLNEALFIGAKAMLELPRGCDYWRDKRMMDMVRGTDSNTDGFDGCMYGLRSRFRNVGVPIKEPWRIISWGYLSTSCFRSVMAHMIMNSAQVRKRE